MASALEESATHDEGVHLAAGYSYWKTGDFRLNPEHPPLSKLLAALPLLWLEPEFAPSPDAWARADQWALSRDFMYDNRVPADRMLLAGRVVTIALGLVLGASLAWWVARRAGPGAGIAALLLLSFEPTVMAHSRYVTSDIPVTLFIWLACAAWFAYLERPNRRVLVTAGLLTGLAFATKLNALILIPIFLTAALWIRRRTEWRSILTVAGIAVPVVMAAYGFDTRAVAQDPPLASRIDAAYPDGGFLRRAADVPIPGYYFLRGIHLLVRHETGGHLTYFRGAIGQTGSWLYFPAALLAKSSLAWLVLLAFAAAAAFGMKKRSCLLPFLLLPPALYLGAGMLSSINIGIRHLLPMYPFLCAFAATTLFDRVRNAGVVLLVLLLAESVTAYPHYLSFFNAAAGGSENGHRLFLDSNLDWGQDLKRLARYTQSRDTQPLCLSYFGTAEPGYYGISYKPLPHVKNSADLEGLDCTVAVSAQHLFGTEGHPFEALQALTPTDRVGASIYVYDLRD